MTRRIVITGGGTGFGKAIAGRLLDERPDLVLVGRRVEVLDAAAAELRAAADVDVTTYGCDLADPAVVQDLADQLAAGPTIDVLVLNAGGNAGVGAGDGLAQFAAAWRADFDANVLTVALLAHAVRDHLTRPGARIIGMSSIAALRGSGSYGAAKAAVNAWMLDLAMQLAPDQITVNTIAPGFVPDTPFWEDRIAADPSVARSRLATIPMGRAGTSAEVAETVAYLAGPGGGWTTGQIIQVNGGTLLGRG